ncbi:MAG: type II secretion system protein GspL, partial [Candidatus Competibacterales bacterium]|nr:type II secretion system protein GspL [Candidatus Competibacterales bacterium]
MKSPALLIRPLDELRFEWSDGETMASGEDEALATAVGNRHLVLAVPGERVTLTAVQAPRRNRGAWRKALPYALEDQLVEDVEQLHFALGAEAADGHTPVAVLRRAELTRWLERLRAQGLEPRAAIPDCLLLPLPEGHWSLLADGDHIRVRTGAAAGFVADPDSLGPLLELARREGEPAGIVIYGEVPPLPA